MHPAAGRALWGSGSTRARRELARAPGAAFGTLCGRTLGG